jgi:hypothetical protein
MTEPVDHEAPSVESPPGQGVAQPAPVVAWAKPQGGDMPGPTGARRFLGIVVSVVALAALVLLSVIRAGAAGTTGSEWLGYVIGGIAIGLLVSAAARWLWLRARRRTDPTARFLSPWIPVGAVILTVVSIFGGNRS